MKKIIVPTDLSNASLKALDIAVDLARHSKATISLLHIREFSSVGVGNYYDIGANISLDEHGKETFNNIKAILMNATAKPQYDGIKISIDIIDGDFNEILTKQNADLIVMSSSGASGVKEFLSGSNAESIVRTAQCPVLVVKGNTENYSIRKVLVATDLENTDFMTKAVKWLNMPNIFYKFVYVDTGKEKFLNYAYAALKNEMIALASKLKITNYDIDMCLAADVETGILESANELPADLILMYTHGRTGLAHLIKGSIAEKVVNHSNIPVMTFS